ncbi:hypothetical protein FLJC2902T_09430 [Flavobacterium limnosediminis JC2902]|uniref:Uncharacterized protein n=1 Tax=Flavobacterium limnosediminis JC2902 TaxID=1341181 RepID=V6SQJ2_9FLAO|nr:hypothetical protein FLJC2902T_09430 [Flavobacterium limnosediminis JC2902]
MHSSEATDEGIPARKVFQTKNPNLKSYRLAASLKNSVQMIQIEKICTDFIFLLKKF